MRIIYWQMSLIYTESLFPQQYKMLFFNKGIFSLYKDHKLQNSLF